MNPKNQARIVGVLFIIASAAPISTIFFLGFLGGAVSGEPITDFLVTVSANEMQVIIGMLIELVWALAVVCILTNTQTQLITTKYFKYGVPCN